MKRNYFDNIYGNEELKEFICAAIENKKTSHAYIIEGASGSGKYTFAKDFACALAPEFEHKIQNELTPDVITLAQQENHKEIHVKEIREFRSSAYILPQEMDIKIYIIRGAEKMNDSGQNALLKVLEEPPQSLYFFLLCQNAAALLPTIRSRASLMRMQLFTEGELDKYLMENSSEAKKLAMTDTSKYQTLLNSAGGSIGNFLAFLGEKSDGKESVAARNMRVETLISYMMNKKRDDVLVYLFTEVGTRETFDEFLSLFQNALRDILIAKYEYNETKLLFFTDTEKLEDYSLSFTKNALVRIYEAAENCREALQNYANVTSEAMNLSGVINSVI